MSMTYRSISRRFILWGGAALSVAGCSDSLKPTIQSNKDSTYSQKLTRVLLATRLQTSASLKNTPLVAENILQAIAAKWTALGVTVDGVDIENPRTGAKDLADAITRFRPEQVAELATASVTSLMGLPTDVVIDCSIYEGASKKRVWRSSISLKGRFGAKVAKIPPDKAAGEIADALTAKLQADGLL
jgi:hypothetical protein